MTIQPTQHTSKESALLQEEVEGLVDQVGMMKMMMTMKQIGEVGSVDQAVPGKALTPGVRNGCSCTYISQIEEANMYSW